MSTACPRAPRVARRVRRRIALVTVACLFTLASLSAGEEAGKVKIGTKTVGEWIADLGSTKREKVQKACWSLSDATHVTGAAELVIPAVMAELTGSKGGSNDVLLVELLEDYGAKATTSAIEHVRAQAHGEGFAVMWLPAYLLMARTPDDVQRAKVLFDRDLPASTAISNEVLHLRDWLGRAAECGIRAQVLLKEVAPFAQHSGVIRQGVLDIAQVLHHAARPMASFLVETLEDKEPLVRDTATISLAWCTDLKPEEEKALRDRIERGVTKGWEAFLTRAVAQVPRADAAADVAWLRGRLANANREVGAWAWNGLARRQVEPEKALANLRRLLKDPDRGVRIAAVDGILALNPEQAAVARQDLLALLEPRDVAVRWRAAAALLRQKDVTPDDKLWTALRDGLEGSSDYERIDLLRWLERIGPPAKELAPLIEAWSTLPVFAIQVPAAQALVAVLKPAEAAPKAD